MGFIPSHVQRKYAAMKSQIHRMIEEKYNVSVTGTGGSEPNDIRGIMVCLESKKHYTIDQTRRMYVQIIQEIVEKINKIKILRPYLHSFPVNENFVDLEIVFRRVEKQPELDNFVYFVCKTEKGIIAYRSASETAYREPYQKAVEFLSEK